MGWEGGHLWLFEVGGREFTDAESAHDLEMEEARRTTLASAVPHEGGRFRYTYDFGDDWHHEVAVERIDHEGATGPTLLGGAGACPPEDVGGTEGYAEFLSVVRDAHHPRRKEWEDWADFDPDFDPEAFDLEAANLRLARS